MVFCLMWNMDILLLQIQKVDLDLMDLILLHRVILLGKENKLIF